MGGVPSSIRSSVLYPQEERSNHAQHRSLSSHTLRTLTLREGSHPGVSVSQSPGLRYGHTDEDQRTCYADDRDRVYMVVYPGCSRVVYRPGYTLLHTRVVYRPGIPSYIPGWCIQGVPHIPGWCIQGVLSPKPLSHGGYISPKPLSHGGYTLLRIVLPSLPW